MLLISSSMHSLNLPYCFCYEFLFLIYLCVPRTGMFITECIQAAEFTSNKVKANHYFHAYLTYKLHR